ncbi:retrovirus-related Pol polyprotein from transposon opus [Nephila pilipes]|uniref:Retrovirus-related Pol polyprotein from transposon opus n=1 Tax=Nephila pilipes TaxID=299642 RepID=A0A8X6TJA0_NEPPI|nr:retrovirus-related Pol polyprotein from transposon opus [Nephila pilipes]
MEVRDVIIYTDHKNLIYAFKKRHDNNSPRQIRHLDYISQFTTYIYFISGGADQARTISYHPKSNSSVKRFHSQLKSALVSHLPDSWLDALRLVLFSILAFYKDEMAVSSAELVYGTTLKLPGELFFSSYVNTRAPVFL